MEYADQKEYNDSDVFLQTNNGHFEYHRQQMQENLRVLSEVDARHKFRVRVARTCLRIFNFICSAVVLGLTASTFAVFNDTRHLTNGQFQAWPPHAYTWPTTVTLVVAAVSVPLNCVILYLLGMVSWRSSSRMETVATVFSIVSFFAGVIMWTVVTGSLKLWGLKDQVGGRDIWTWTCKQGPRRDAFEGQINFERLCFQNKWNFICANLQIGAEIITVGVTVFALYRRVTKKRLAEEKQNYKEYINMNTIDVRDN
ncbi:hypothetical protein V1520DRAFT_345565 [Lipomyces starkeyi]|uniref:MARVEL domain-containing protein n=1 Tax=Lipomyces starkeyi NRRL Y-11557 TaxID=675824 RepID=A0A1E3QDQ3_LIPST|nr:hypothetical protein LIPSTDRAFT_69329 [Lipomyces starkeyi NRRL Y-11557]